LAMCHRQ